MLNLFARIVCVVLLFIGVLALIGCFLPRAYDFQTELKMKAAPADIFPMVNTPRSWRDWSMWSPDRIPDLKVEYRGKDSGVGAEQFWTEVRGSGKMWITASQPNERVDYEMVFQDFPRMESSIRLQVEGDSTRVTWQSQGSLPSGPFFGYFAWLFPRQMEYQYQTSLENLKELVEQ